MNTCAATHFTHIDELDDAQRSQLVELLRDAFPREPRELLDVQVSRCCDLRNACDCVAMRVDMPVGAVLARQSRNGTVFVVYLAVADPWRRRGIARSLLDELAATGPSKFTMFVDEHNQPAERLYRDGGLAPDGEPAPAGQRQWSGNWRTRPLTSTAARRCA